MDDDVKRCCSLEEPHRQAECRDPSARRALIREALDDLDAVLAKLDALSVDIPLLLVELKRRRDYLRRTLRLFDA